MTLLCPSNALTENASQLDAIMLRQCDSPEDLRNCLADTRLSSVCLGPGLGLGPEQAALVATALAHGRGLVLDADAITHLARSPEMAQTLHEGCVLTPHAGEFARLFPEIAARLDAPATRGPAYSKLDATRDAARLIGATVLFKGPDTVVATPERASGSARGLLRPRGSVAGHGGRGRRVGRSDLRFAGAGVFAISRGLLGGVSACRFAPAPSVPA